MSSLLFWLICYVFCFLKMTKVSCVFSDLLNVFEVFLPQLLLYPNASDPLNGDAASLMMKDKKLYDQKVKGEHIVCYVLLFLIIEDMLYWFLYFSYSNTIPIVC